MSNILYLRYAVVLSLYTCSVGKSPDYIIPLYCACSIPFLSNSEYITREYNRSRHIHKQGKGGEQSLMHSTHC
jgi:hypothetical protein